MDTTYFTKLLYLQEDKFCIQKMNKKLNKDTKRLRKD